MIPKTRRYENLGLVVINTVFGASNPSWSYTTLISLVDLPEIASNLVPFEIYIPS